MRAWQFHFSLEAKPCISVWTIYKRSNSYKWVMSSSSLQRLFAQVHQRWWWVQSKSMYCSYCGYCYLINYSKAYILQHSNWYYCCSQFLKLTSPSLSVLLSSCYTITIIIFFPAFIATVFFFITITIPCESKKRKCITQTLKYFISLIFMK